MLQIITVGDKSRLLHRGVKKDELCEMEGRRRRLRCRPEGRTGYRMTELLISSLFVFCVGGIHSLSTFHSHSVTFSDVLFYRYISKHLHS